MKRLPLPRPLIESLVTISIGLVAGALLMLLFDYKPAPPALLKAWRGVHEVISTIMCNWIAFYLATYLAINFLAEPGRAERTAPALVPARYPVLTEDASLTAAIFVALAFCLVVYLYLWGTRAGYELRLAGENPDAARYAGGKGGKGVLLSFAIGGLAAGLAGGTQILRRPP